MLWRSNGEKTKVNVLRLHVDPTPKFSSIPGQENFLICFQKGAAPELLPALSLLTCPYPEEGTCPVRGRHGCPPPPPEMLCCRLVTCSWFACPLSPFVHPGPHSTQDLAIRVEQAAFFCTSNLPNTRQEEPFAAS